MNFMIHMKIKETSELGFDVVVRVGFYFAR